MPRVYQDDIADLLEARGWQRGAGGDMYFPRNNGYPHLHAKINPTGDYDNIVRCFSYLGETFGGGGRNINLVNDGSAVYTNPGARRRIPQDHQTEAAAVMRLDLP